MACSMAAVALGATAVTAAVSTSSVVARRSSSTAPLALTTTSSFHGRVLTSSNAGARLRLRPGQICRLERVEQRNVVLVNATAVTDVASSEPAAESAVAVEPANPIAALKLESDLLKKKAKKLELRRKRLVRKRHLRKKGRWPPSKMKKNQNV